MEGSITTEQDAERIHRVRRVSRRLVTIGACATAGGIQGLRNFTDVEDLVTAVYPSPEYVHTLEYSTPISAHVPVDFELQGCPVNKYQLLEVIRAALGNRKPAIPASSVCQECKLRGNVCVMVAHGTPCLGPVTHAGCGALCPSYDRGCYGCFGPMESPNTELSDHLVPEAGHGRRRPRSRVPDVQRRARRPSDAKVSAMTVTPERQPRSRRIRTAALARVEGEGAMSVRIRGREVLEVQLRIYEPPRFFEGILKGRSYTEVPDITARICGICPVAYQTSGSLAIEQACGVTVDGPIRELRRLMYCGEWIESHALHLYLLHAPDFLGYESAIHMAADHPALVERGLATRKAGNQLLITLGGRAEHPINPRTGRLLSRPQPG